MRQKASERKKEWHRSVKKSEKSEEQAENLEKSETPTCCKVSGVPFSVPSASRQPDVRPSPATTKRFRSFDDVGDDLSDWRCDDDDFKLYLSDDDSDEENEKSVEEFVDIQNDTNI